MTGAVTLSITIIGNTMIRLIESNEKTSFMRLEHNHEKELKKIDSNYQRTIETIKKIESLLTKVIDIKSNYCGSFSKIYDNEHLAAIFNRLKSIDSKSFEVVNEYLFMTKKGDKFILLFNIARLRLDELRNIVENVYNGSHVINEDLLKLVNETMEIYSMQILSKINQELTEYLREYYQVDK